MLLTRILVEAETNDPKERADFVRSRVVPLGQRFYPSESAFPLRWCFPRFLHFLEDDLFLPEYIATLLVGFMLRHKEDLETGWGARILIDCGVRYAEIWDLFHEMYESEVQ